METEDNQFQEAMAGFYNQSLHKERKSKKNYTFLMVFLFGLVISYILFPFVAMWAWNLGLAAIFTLPKVTFLQAVATFVLIKVFQLAIFGYKTDD